MDRNWIVWNLLQTLFCGLWNLNDLRLLKSIIHHSKAVSLNLNITLFLERCHEPKTGFGPQISKLPMWPCVFLQSISQVTQKSQQNIFLPFNAIFDIWMEFFLIHPFLSIIKRLLFFAVIHTNLVLHQNHLLILRESGRLQHLRHFLAYTVG